MEIALKAEGVEVGYGLVCIGLIWKVVGIKARCCGFVASTYGRVE
jgi:hypothetical protein